MTQSSSDLTGLAVEGTQMEDDKSARDHARSTCAATPESAAPKKGSVRILCDEIGFRFDPRLERPEVLVAFVRELVSEVAELRDMAQTISHLTGKPPSEGSASALAVAEAMLSVDNVRAWIGGAAMLHDACGRLNPEDACPTDHLIDMLSSCASAIRFGLEDRGELGFSSRHAASAASHVWKQVYGVSRFDSETPAWEHEWARGKLLSAIISLVPVASRAAESSPRQVEDASPGQAKSND